MSDGAVHYRREGAIAHVIFDRPKARNAMTWTMYEQLALACEQVAADAHARVVLLRGAGNRAFIAGTDIAQFQAFSGADDGVRYEQDIARLLAKLEALPVPTLAAIDGWTVGGGLAIAAVCDLRIATAQSRFGVPIARTLGNCLSIENIALLAAQFGAARVKKMLVLGEMLSADEAYASGFLCEIVPGEELQARALELCERLARNAPLTMRVSKEALRRLMHAGMPAGEDLIRMTYGSEDFRIGVAAFLAKCEPQWTGH
jgi:enoyl-CoA hydratase/carnithine racemase